jgi:hypothetical protein
MSLLITGWRSMKKRLRKLTLDSGQVQVVVVLLYELSCEVSTSLQVQKFNAIVVQCGPKLRNQFTI